MLLRVIDVAENPCFGAPQTWTLGISGVHDWINPKQKKERIIPPMSKFCFLFAVVAIAAFGARAQVINAKSCSQADVQAAFNSVTTSTDTVNIPAGNCSWTGQVALNIPSGNNNLSVFGAGNLNVQGGGDATVIVDNDTADQNPLLEVNTSSNTAARVRLAGFTLEGGSGTYKQNGIMQIGGFSHNFRLDHFHLNANTYSTGNNPRQNAILRNVNWIHGVFDHSIIDGPAAYTVYEDEYNGDTQNDGAGYESWADTTQFGTSNAFYMEDNTFTYNGGQPSSFMDDCYAGARLVIRYNTMTSTDVQTHPTGGAGNLRGCRMLEVYGNKFNGSNSTPTSNVVWMSSGTGLFWGNVASAGYQNFLNIHSMRISDSTYSESAPPTGWGYCGSAFSGNPSPWDQNSNSSGYRCLDEPGTGKSDLLRNWFPLTCDVTTGGCDAGIHTGTWPHQALEPIYEWQNSWNPVPSYSGQFINLDNAPALEANVDFYQHTASFDGTNGVGAGPLSSRPSTCKQGVGYWATDQGNWNQSGSAGQGELFVCSAANTWTPYYTPYTYPHPLISGGGGGGGGGTQGPGTPSNLTGTVH
jgi:hypothetical protein